MILLRHTSVWIKAAWSVWDKKAPVGKQAEIESGEYPAKSGVFCFCLWKKSGKYRALLTNQKNRGENLKKGVDRRGRDVVSYVSAKRSEKNLDKPRAVVVR